MVQENGGETRWKLSSLHTLGFEFSADFFSHVQEPRVTALSPETCFSFTI